MGKSKRAAWEERRQRRLAGDPLARQDFLYHKAGSKVNYIDKFGLRYYIIPGSEINKMIKVPFIMPTDEQQLTGCDGCRMKHSPKNFMCGANGGIRVLSPGHRFAFPAAGSMLYLVALTRNRKRQAHIVYKVRIREYNTLGKRRAGYAELEILGTGTRTYKSL